MKNNKNLPYGIYNCTNGKFFASIKNNKGNTIFLGIFPTIFSANEKITYYYTNTNEKPVQIVKYGC